ncbi:hypothetical protein CYLTODRAFT_359994, partial [Cylindrobasidium torrendii FP15055 ss-10]
MLQRTVLCASVIMLSRNQQCNILAGLIGIYLHSCNVPENVITTLSHMGVSISVSSINSAISSLSPKAATDLQSALGTFTYAIAYDNLDINLRPSTTTIENAGPTLHHLTTGMAIKLNHIEEKDLACADKLWKASPLN